MLAVVTAASSDSAGLYVVGTIGVRAGFGVAFLGALRALSAAIGPEHRGSVMSAFYVVAYASRSLPAILAGVLDPPLGLRATFEIFGSAIAALALIVAFLAWRTRPRDANAVVNRSRTPTRTGTTRRPPGQLVEVHILGRHGRRPQRHRDPQRLRATRARLLRAGAR